MGDALYLLFAQFPESRLDTIAACTPFVVQRGKVKNPLPVPGPHRPLVFLGGQGITLSLEAVLFRFCSGYEPI